VNFAINSRVVEAFLDANGVDYKTAPSTSIRGSAEIAERAKRFTVPIECLK